MSSATSSTSTAAWRNTTAQVYTELGGWGMPTLDAEGLAALALLRFVGIPVTLKSGSSLSMTESHSLPVVVFEKVAGGNGGGTKVISGLSQLIGYLSSNVNLPDPNKDLTPFMVAESTAFISLVQSRYAPTRMFELYGVDANYAEVYRTLLETERAFPLNLILPYMRRREILRGELKGRDKDALYFDSKIALTALSTRLGSSSFFYNKQQPSVLDAVVFGYLASILYIPLPKSSLRGQISSFPNLVDFTNRIAERYFRDQVSGNIINPSQNAEFVSQMNHTNVQDRARRSTPGAPGEDIEQLSEEERERRKWNGYFLWGSVGIFITHLLVGNDIEFEIS